MKKVTQNGTVASHERYLYRGYLQIAALDMLDNRNVLRTLLWDPLEPVATRPLALVQGASLYCYGVDFNKNVSEVFDAQGTIAAAYDYSPYGTATRTGRLVQPVQWSGEMHDEEPALVYYNYRFYNPKDGRWINRDPIAEEGGWNLYGFVDNNPIDSFDINGRSTLHGAAGQAIVAAFRTGNLTSLRNLARLGKDQRVCDALKTLESTARTLISKSRGGRVNREFPSQYYEKAYHQIIKEANAGSATAKKALKLIRDLRFSK